MTRLITIMILFLLSDFSAAQEIDITDYLKAIEKGKAENVREKLPELKAANPYDASVVFLDAALTEDGNIALKKYQSILKFHPENKYADAALYRIFSYYYSLGSYKTADNYLEKLKKEYPDSPYIKAAERNFPDEEITAAEVKPKIKPKAEPAAGSVPAYKFTVQAGAFLNKNNADKLKRNLIAEGYESSVYQKNAAGSILNVVTAGKFADKSGAQKLLNLLKNKYKINGRIVPLGEKTREN